MEQHLPPNDGRPVYSPTKWILFGAAASWASYAILIGPDIQHDPWSPTVIPRPPSAKEVASLVATGRRLTSELSELTTIPTIDNVESLLTNGVPDNPLVPGVAGIYSACSLADQPSPPLDWRFCDRDATITPTIPKHSL